MLGKQELFLDRDNATYELLAESIPEPDGTGGAEATLSFIEGIARIAWHAHPGKYADGKIENVLLRVGESLESHVESMASATDWHLPDAPSKPGRRILHIATEVYAVGGHTRLLKNWIQNDADSTHSVVLTAQSSGSAVPEWFSDTIAKNDGRLIRLPLSASRLSKAKWLRDIAKSFDSVILHHHPFDVVPTVAFAIASMPPVAVLNHADHVFWLGSGVADMVINLRPAGKLLSETRRMVSRNELLPIPLELHGVDCSRGEAREKLGIDEGQIMILTVGSASKYLPNSTHNFFATAKALLERHRAAHLYMVGTNARDAQRYDPSGHPRLHCVGVVENPAAYYAAADLYLEGFPFGSLTALLQAAREGLPVVLPFGIESPVLSTDDIAVTEVPRVHDEAEYLQQVAILIDGPDRRAALGASLQDRVLAFHTGSGWQRLLNQIYAELDGLVHKPSALPDGVFERTPDDLALSKLDATSDDVPQFSFLNDNYSSINCALLARLLFTFPALRPSRPVYKYYSRWLRVIWRRVRA